MDPHEKLHRSLWINIGSYVAQITLDLHGNRAARREKGKSVTESLAGRKEKQRRVGDTEKEGRREARRKEEGEDEGDGKSKVKPVTEWAGMTDWVMAGRK